MDFTRAFVEASPLLWTGIVMTVEITLISLVIAFFLGLGSCLMGLSKNFILKGISKFYVWIIRGTPLLVQAFYVYFALPQLIQGMGVNFRLTPFIAGIIVLSLNAGAYISELLRGGIQAVDKGQTEAARSLGMTKTKTMAKVVLPQALRISTPSLVNQVIITLKDTSIISMIGLAEVVYQAKIYIGRTMESFATWTIVGLMYLVVITLLSWLSRYIEKKMSYGNKD